MRGEFYRGLHYNSSSFFQNNNNNGGSDCPASVVAKSCNGFRKPFSSSFNHGHNHNHGGSANNGSTGTGNAAFAPRPHRGGGGGNGATRFGAPTQPLGGNGYGCRAKTFGRFWGSENSGNNNGGGGPPNNFNAKRFDYRNNNNNNSGNNNWPNMNYGRGGARPFGRGYGHRGGGGGSGRDAQSLGFCHVCPTHSPIKTHRRTAVGSNNNNNGPAKSVVSAPKTKTLFGDIKAENNKNKMEKKVEAEKTPPPSPDSTTTTTTNVQKMEEKAIKKTGEVAKAVEAEVVA